MTLCDPLRAHDSSVIAADIRYGASESLDLSLAQQRCPWLTDREQIELTRWRDLGRRQCWLRARFLAKQLVLARHGKLTMLDVEILSSGVRGRPRVYCSGSTQPWRISISHTDAGALVAISWSAENSIGADLTPLQALSAGFVRLWYTECERAWLRSQASALGPNLLWAVKESLYKACNRGERFDPRQIVAIPGRCRYLGVPLHGCDVQTRIVNYHIAALAVVSSVENHFDDFIQHGHQGLQQGALS
jgi:phosphopantetheinyl transferase